MTHESRYARVMFLQMCERLSLVGVFCECGHILEPTLLFNCYFYDGILLFFAILLCVIMIT